MPALAALCSDHAVLQRDRPLRLHGSATPGAEVTVRFAGHTATTRADDGGRWEAALPALPAGGPHVLEAADATGTVTARNLHVGEVWLCGGQSNMEWSLAQSGSSETEVHGAQFPAIHLFRVPRRPSLQAETDVAAHWTPCTPETARDFSAVAYHFARRLLPDLPGVHVGLIQAAWGGSLALPWMPRTAVAAEPRFASALRLADAVRRFGSPGLPAPCVDTGLAPEASAWSEPAHDDAAWPTMTLPALWQDCGLDFNGAVWFRRTVAIPPAWSGRALVLELGKVDDHDQTFFNGERVGGIGVENPNAWNTPRRYPVPAALVRPGAACLALRVFDHFGKGGVVGPAPRMRLSPADDPESEIPLAGPWRYRVERAIPLPPPRPEDAALGDPTQTATVLWNGMLAPLAGFPLRGFLWYQGESDEPRAHLYRTILPALIRSWRAAWRDDSLPFYLVQLPPFRVPHATGPHCRPELREAQIMATEAEPDVELIVTLDCGDPHDNHPADKRTVGHRLAHVALARDYGIATPWRGPRLAEIEQRPRGVRLTFAQAAGGLRSRDGAPLREFEIASGSGQFVAAVAEVEGATVFVRAPETLSPPFAVRHAWSDAPAANLENAAGLPAAPFRTDDRPGATVGAE